MEPGTAAAVPGFMGATGGIRGRIRIDTISPLSHRGRTRSGLAFSISKTSRNLSRYLAIVEPTLSIRDFSPDTSGPNRLCGSVEAALNWLMSQNTVLESQGDFPPGSTSRTVLPQLSVAAPFCAGPVASTPKPAVALDPVRSLAEAWYAQSAADWSAPVRRPFDAQYWACWLVTLVLPALVAYLLLAR